MTTSRSTRRLGLSIAAALLAWAAVPAAFADDFSDRFDFHGYGYQNYMQSSQNTYMGADKEGTWDNNFIGLVMAATLNEQSKLWAQLQGSAAEGTRFTWFFVDYQINEDLRAHAGRVKLPLGLYNEIIDVRSLQLSALQPVLYQEAADMVHDAYQGVGFDYEQDIGSAGHLLWQVWGGDTYDTDPPSDSADRRAWGGRITYRTPIDGLRFMLSTYRTRVELLADGSMTNEDRLMGSAEYLHGNWDLKSEYSWHKALLHAGGDSITSYAYYVQAGYTFADKWTPYARYDYVTTDKTQRSDPSYYQKVGVLGLGYKLSSNIGLRLEAHLNRGYALPVASGEVVAGAGSPHWNMVVAGMNFAF